MVGRESHAEEDMSESETITVREWDADAFQRRVLELEAEGYATRLDSYQILAEMNPETGEVIHLRSIEMRKLVTGTDRKDRDLRGST